MRLKDFLLDDLAVPFEFKTFPDFLDNKTSIKLGTSEGFDIYGSRYYGEDLDAYGILSDDNKPIAIIVIKTKERVFDRLKFQEIEKLWVDPNHRGKALMISLINFVIRKQHTNISSGDKLTNDGKNLFQKIIDKKSFDVEYVDLIKRQKLDQIPSDLFKFPNNYQIVLVERIYESADRMLGHGPGICEEMRRFREYNSELQEWD